jgi:hypothetical protein
MKRVTVPKQMTKTTSAGSSPAVPGSEKIGSAEQTWKDAWAHDRIRTVAYALYEQRGCQEGRALEDWLNAERQLVSESGQL